MLLFFAFLFAIGVTSTTFYKPQKQQQHLGYCQISEVSFFMQISKKKSSHNCSSVKKATLNTKLNEKGFFLPDTIKYLLLLPGKKRAGGIRYIIGNIRKS